MKKTRIGALALGVSATLLTMTACSGAAEEAPKAAELAAGEVNFGSGHWKNLVAIDMTDADPEVPSSTVVLAQAPYWDHSTEEIGIQKGYYADAGIAIGPEPSGKIVPMDQVASSLLTGQLDVGTMVPQIWAPQLDSDLGVALFTWRDVMIGHSILASPKTRNKSVKEFMADGLDWDSAVVEALDQVRGKKLYVSNDPAPRAFYSVAIAAGGLDKSDLDMQTLDEKSVQGLALGGKADYVAPGSGPNLTQLMAQGWVQIVSTGDILENGDDEDINDAVTGTGLAASHDWLEGNPDTAMRMASVGYRIVDFKESDPIGSGAIQIPFINSIAGTNFKISDAKIFDEQIDPFFTFEEQEEFFENESSPLYWRKGLEASFANLKRQGLLKNDHDPDELVWAASTWQTLKALRVAAEPIIAELKADSTLSKKAEDQLQEAEQFFEARNYFDALRFANAAKLNS